MLKRERAEYILQHLEELYPETPVPLDHINSYTLLIAVLLSAQCTDERVNKITPILFSLADTPQNMIQQDVEDIRAIIRPCGLSSRKSQAIWKLSEIILNRHGGVVPENFSDLEALPGVGHKTASVVMSQAFGHPAFAVDTHIHRLAQRWGLTKGKNVNMTEADCKKLFLRSSWSKLHLRIIFYGREYCTARGCDGTICPMCRILYPCRVNPPKVNKA